MRHEKRMDLKNNAAGTPLYGVRHGKESQTPQPELRQGTVHGNNSCVVHHDSGTGICDRANGLDCLAGGAEMVKYTEVYPFKAMDEIKAGTKVYMLDKAVNTTKQVNCLPFDQAIKALEDKGNRFYFWKAELVDQEEPQATENEE